MEGAGAKVGSGTGARVGVAGDNCIDAYEDGDGIRYAVGGNALNVAVNFSRLGVACDYFGAIGDDDHGCRVREAAESAGVSSHLRVIEGSTWITFVRTDAGGTTRVVRQDPGASGPYVPTADEFSLLSRCDLVHMANMVDPRAATSALRRSDVVLSYDHGTEHSLAAPVDIAFFSCDRPGSLPRGVEIAKQACGGGAALAVVTLGPGGSLAFDGTHLITQSARQMRPVDTLGAGDSYIGAFLASRLAGQSIESAMSAGTQAASSTCLHWAAWPQEAWHQNARNDCGEIVRKGGDSP